MKTNSYRKLFVALLILAQAEACFGQADPASEPAVLAVAKVLPAVVNINTERVVRRTVRDPFEDFYAQFFGYNRARPREIRQTLQSLGSGFIIDPEGILRHMSINELDVGRNVSETLRVLQALRTGELCPVGWTPGESTLTTYDEWLAKALPRLSKQVLVDTTKKLQTTKYSAGQMVFEQGDAPDRFYIISGGEVEVVRRRRDGSEKILAVLHPGDYFGEIGLLTEARRNASIRAKTDVELLAMNWDDFRRVIESSEASRKDFADIMRERLAQT